ncbi:MAG: Do family serine endopeptidase [Hyphomicrobium sp.]
MRNLSRFCGRSFGILAALVIMAGAVSSASKRGPHSVAPVAEELIEAVVNISTSQGIRGPRGIPLPNVPKGSPFEDLFEDFFDNDSGRPLVPNRKVSSLGSGFVIDGKEGIIVTNNHVIDGAEEISVKFHDGTQLNAEIVGIDTKTDIALLKVKPKKELKAVSFGVSSNIKVGDWVMAIGNPFGLGGTVTVGIISAKARNINSGPYDDYLQTDASINKGNSGGPLFNMDGEVIGVNTAIISPTGGSIGIGFAVPSDTASSVVQQLRTFGEVRRGWLGVKIQTVTDGIAGRVNVPAHTGALIAAVSPDSPAAKAGLKSGDVIVKFDGRNVTQMRALPRLVARTPIDKTVDVEVRRKGEKKTLRVTIGRLADDNERPKALSRAPDNGGQESEMSVLGLKLSTLNDKLRSKYGFGADVTGAIVSEVDPESPAAKRISPGDVIVEAAQEPVTDPQDIARKVEDVKRSGGKTVQLGVEDALGGYRFIAIPVQ